MAFAIALGNTIGALSSLIYYKFKARLNFVGVYAVIYLSMAVGYAVVASANSYAMALLGIVLAGIGFGLVTTAMFVGQFSAPILAQPIIDPDDPTAVWRSVSIALLGLAILYGLLARVSGTLAATSSTSTR